MGRLLHVSPGRVHVIRAIAPFPCPFPHRQKLNKFAGLRLRSRKPYLVRTALRHVIGAALSTAVPNLRLRPISGWWRAGSRAAQTGSYDMRQRLPAQDSREPDCSVGSRERSVAEPGDDGSPRPDRLMLPRPRRMGAIGFGEPQPRTGGPCRVELAMPVVVTRPCAAASDVLPSRRGRGRAA